MIHLYTWNTPNGQKACIMLEEVELPYQIHAINISQGDQRTEAFLAINPNGKIPAIIDQEAGNEQRVFESGAVLVYLAEKTGKLLPNHGVNRSEALSWTFWQVGGLGPMLGQLGHFLRSAPEKLPYAIQRYLAESTRLLHVLNHHLEDKEFIASDYSIADIANYPWVLAGLNMVRTADSESAENLTALHRWVKTVGNRPAVAKALAALRTL